jgi:hypothetical protein
MTDRTPPEANASGPTPFDAIPRRAPSAWTRLSYSQERLWFLDQLDPGNPAYHRPWAVRLQGALDAAALEGCLNEIIRRHEILRTNYTAVDGIPMQSVRAHAPRALPIVDLTQALPAEREARARDRIAAEALRPFDLGHDDLTRPLLLKLGDEDHVLLFLTHHIAFDGWSEGVLLRELAALYPARIAGRPSPLPEPQVQYADFAAWQRTRQADGQIGPHLRYWKQVFAAPPPRLQLPTDPRHHAASGWEAGRLSVGLGTELTLAARGLARQENATLFMALLAAFLVLLHRQTGHGPGRRLSHRWSGPARAGSKCRGLR